MPLKTSTGEAEAVSLSEFKTTLVYIESVRPDKATQ